MTRERRQKVQPVLHTVGSGSRGNRATTVTVDRKGERLGRQVVLILVVEELVVRRGIRGHPARGIAEVPAGEHARGGIHVLLGVVADTEREQLHHFPSEVLLRTRTDVRPAIEPHDHGRVFRDLDEQVSKIAEGVLSEKLDLALRSWQLAELERHHLGGLNGTHNPRHLAVGGREVVMPEQRHLFLQRTL